jgi:hypothetical protein
VSSLWKAIVAIVLIAAVGGVRRADADTKNVVLDWKAVKFPDSCVGVNLGEQGQANFTVNAMPLPTYTVEDPYTAADGSVVGHHQAAFNTALFRVGSNRIGFTATNSGNMPECTHIEDRVWLDGVADQRLLLFHILSIGTDVDAETEKTLSLAEIDPELAAKIERLLEELRNWIDVLDERGPEADRAAADQQRLEALLEAMEDLLERGFDEITVEELDALLEDFADILPGLYDQLVDIVEGFKQDIEALRQEIERISGEFRDWADSVVDFGDDVAGGFDGTDFESPDDDPLPEVEVPDVLGDDPWSEDHDPYADYADEVIASLQTTIDTAESTVVDRAGFVAIIRAWRHNIEVLEVGLQSQGAINQAEYGAFLQSVSRVLSFVSAYMDPEGWFVDSPVPPEIRELVDGALRDRDRPRAERIKAALNLIDRLESEQAAVVFAWFFMMKEVGIAVQQSRVEHLRAKLVEKEKSLWDSVVGVVEDVASVGWDVAVAVTPLGDLVDACEALTGRENCNLASGRELSWKERAFAGVGLLMWGSSASVRKLANEVDAIGCRPHFAWLGLLTPKCDAGVFVDKLDDAMERVQKKRPRRDLAGPPVVHADGSVTYRHVNGTEVTFNSKGFPEFEPRHMHPTAPKAQVWVEFDCNSNLEIKRANELNGWGPSTPENWTWHHSHEFWRTPDDKIMISMLLVDEEIHDWARHAGGSAIGKQILGAALCK